MAASKRALIVIDVQNEYLCDGALPLWNFENTLINTEQAIALAHALGVPVILVRHIADSQRGPSPFFNDGTRGAEIHPRIRSAAPSAPIVVKHFADGFHHTTLEATLHELAVEELLICGMMTQNCVTHTAISKSAEKYTVSVLPDCCTTVSEVVHLIALNALSTRLPLIPSGVALS